MYGGAAGGGKAQPLAGMQFHAVIKGMICTPFGFKKFDEIEVGDQVSNPDGSVARVIAVHEQGIVSDFYKVTFIDGASTVVTGEHLWVRRLSGKRLKAERRMLLPDGSWGDNNKLQVVTTEMLQVELNHAQRQQEEGKRPNWPLIPMTEPVQFTVTSRYAEGRHPIEPYLLGVLLGDGALSHSVVHFVTEDQEILDHINLPVVEYKGNGGSATPYRLADEHHVTLTEGLDKLGLRGKRSWEKFIPEQYKVAPLDIRWGVIQGLMDADGYADSRGHTEFASVSLQLAEDVQWICRSLGFKATLTKKQGGYRSKNGDRVDTRMAYTVHISGDQRPDLFRLSRKRERCQYLINGGTPTMRRVTDIQPLDAEGEARCITVDHPNGLYVTDDFIVTHNSDALLVEALRQVNNPHYRGVLFRRTYKQLEQAKGLIDRSHQLYPAMGGKYKAGSYSWEFSSGATIRFAHLQHEEDKYNHDGAAYQFIGFDELRHFSQDQFLYLFSRARSTEDANLKVYIRAGTNPGGSRASWIKKMWAPWIETKPDLNPNPAKPGEIRWFTRVEDRDVEVDPNHPNARSRTFIPAKISDNPHLMGTEYESNLELLPRVERLRLKEGDWDVMETSGEVINSAWFNIVDGIPADVNRVRFWDIAATVPSTRGDDPDYTVGALIARDRKNHYYIEDMVRIRRGWGAVKETIKHYAERDGREVMLGMEQEPGASGKALVYEMTSYLSGFPVQFVRPVRDKVSRARIWTGPAELGMMSIVRADWNGAFFDECEMFPDGDHDDMVDAVSGACDLLMSGHGIYI